jgi:hypothetical protein
MEVSGQLHTLAALPLRKKAASIHWIGGWVGPTALLDVVVKGKIPSPWREPNPGGSARSLVAILTDLHKNIH